VVENGLSDLDKKTIARLGTKITQFTVNPIDLPPAWNSQVGKLTTQFKSFAYKQGEFMTKEVLGPILKDKNISPLLRWILVGSLLGEGSSDLKALIQLKKRSDNPVQREGENLASVGGMGIIGDTVSSAASGKDRLLELLSGPTVGDLANVASSTVQAASGKPSSLMKYLIGNVPVAGPSLRNILYPSAAATAAEKSQYKAPAGGTKVYQPYKSSKSKVYQPYKGK
jgi:hypothetical protein